MQTMYIFELGRLVGVQDVTNWPVEMIDRTLAGLVMCRRTGEVSDKGRGICCVCHKDMGERELPSGRLSHGLCDRAECVEKVKWQPAVEPRALRPGRMCRKSQKRGKGGNSMKKHLLVIVVLLLLAGCASRYDKFHLMLNEVNRWQADFYDKPNPVFIEKEIKFRLVLFGDPEKAAEEYERRYHKKMISTLGLVRMANGDYEIWLPVYAYRPGEFLTSPWGLGHEVAHILNHLSNTGKLGFKFSNPDTLGVPHE